MTLSCGMWKVEIETSVRAIWRWAEKNTDNFFSSGVLHEKKSIAQKTTNTNHKGRNADPPKQRPNKNNHNQDFPGHSGEKPLCREKNKRRTDKGTGGVT